MNIQTPVIQGQPVAADGSFRVNNIQAGEARMDLNTQWLHRPDDERFTSLSDLLAATRARRETSYEARLPSKAIEFVAPDPTCLADTQKLTVALPGNRLASPSHWSFGQLAQLARAPAGYLRTLPSQIAADALNYGLRYNRDVEELKLLGTGGSGAPELRAATGPNYGRIWDADVVEAVMQFAGDGTGDTRWRIPGEMNWTDMVYRPAVDITKQSTTLFASDRDVFIFLVDDLNPIVVGYTAKGEPDVMFRGFFVYNSEVGSKTLKIAAFYLRSVCCNRIVWGTEGFQEVTIRHTSLAPSRFLEEARPALMSFAQAGTRKLVEAVEEAKAAKVAKDEDEAVAFLIRRTFTKSRATEIIEACKAEEGVSPRSAWDFANGITAVARTIPHTNDRLALELEAGRILDKVA